MKFFSSYFPNQTLKGFKGVKGEEKVKIKNGFFITLNGGPRLGQERDWEKIIRLNDNFY